MIHAIVGVIAAGCVLAGFIIGSVLIIESIIKSGKRRGR
jgi:hypothetical protein